MSFAVLGPLLLGGEPVKVGQLSRLLGLLLVDHDRPVATRELARWVLDESRADDAAQIQVLVARLRRQLRERAAPASVDTVNGGYRLGLTVGSLDADRFEALLGDPVATRAELLAALRLWRGEVLAGLGLEEHPMVVRLEELRADALERLFTADLAGRLHGRLRR